jgi:hypothetical protein
MLVLNALGALSHLVGVVLTATRGRWSYRLHTFRAIPVNAGNATHPVLVRAYEDAGPVYPTQITLVFFALSLSFHAAISAFLLVHRLAPRSNIAEWYLRGLERCRAPHRWLEYFFSAPIMVLINTVLLGVRDVYSLWTVVGTMAVTQIFGWLTEVHSSALVETVPEGEGARFMGYCLTRRWKRGSRGVRLQFHLFGYAPYVLGWAIQLDGFSRNMEHVGDAVPGWVNYAVWSTFFVFTLFGFVQLWNQLYEFGPSLYWLGEAVYVFLSFAAKANLGFVVLYQALIAGSEFDAVLGSH